MNKINAGKAKIINDDPGTVFLVNRDCRSIVSADGSFLQVNRKWLEVIGYTCRDLRRKQFLLDIPALVAPGDAVATFLAIEELGMQNEAVRFDAELMCRDNAYRQFEWCAQQRNKSIYVVAKLLGKRKKKKNAGLQCKPVRAVPELQFLDVIETFLNGRKRTISEN